MLTAERKQHLHSCFKTLLLYLCAFLIPIVAQIITYKLLKLYPFGKNTLINWDLRLTYTYYFEWFRNVLLGDGSVFYSFSKSLGGNMIAGFSTICASPVNLLLVLFSSDNPVKFVTIAITVKYGLAGITSLFYLRDRFNIKPVYAVSLAVGYATMTFMTSQSMNPMWMDAVIMLPLVLAGLYRLIMRNQIVFFYVSLTLAILVDWYNGYQICLFCIMYYLFECIANAPEAKKNGDTVRLGFMIAPLRFSIVFTLAVLSSFVLLIPTAIGLLGGKGAAESNLLSPDVRFYLPDFIRSLTLGEYQRERLPQLYTGTLALLCSIAFFLNSAVSKRERIALLAFLLLLLFSMWFAPLDRVWCGFRDGQSFYCRFSYLFSVLLVYAAARNIEQAGDTRKKSLIVSALTISCVCVYILACNLYFNVALPIISIFLAVLFAALLLVNSRESSISYAKKAVLCIIILMLATVDATASTYQVVGSRVPVKKISSTDRYDEYFGQGRDQFVELDSNDGTDVNAYRVQKMYQFLSKFPEKVHNDVYVSSNEGFVYGYSQISQYDSTYDDAVQNFICNLGYCPEALCWTTFSDPVIPSDSLLGIKYISDTEAPMGYVDVGLEKTQDGHKFYENPYALPLGFVASRDIVDEYIEAKADGTLEKNPFNYQNQLFGALLGKPAPLYQPLEYVHKDAATDAESWVVKVPAKTFAYGYIACSALHLDVFVDGQNIGLNLAGWKYGIFPIYNPSDKEREMAVEIRINPDYSHQEGFSIASYDKQPYFYALDLDAFVEARNILASEPFDISVFDDGYVKGECETNRNDGVLFTSIPYDSGWKVTVNGADVQAYAAQNTFMAIPITPGRNEIVMSYISPGFIPGLAISSLSLFAFVIYAFVRKRKAKRNA